MYKTLRRIMAIIGIIILAGIYITTFIIAICGNESTKGWFIACIFATVAVPCFIWAVSFIYKRLKGDMEEINSNGESR